MKFVLKHQNTNRHFVGIVPTHTGERGNTYKRALVCMNVYVFVYYYIM